MSAVDPDEARENIIAGVVSFSFVALIVWAFGLDVGIYQFAGMLTVILALGWISRNTADLTVGFIILSLAILYLLIDLLAPTFLTEPFGVFIAQFESLVGFAPSDVPPWALFVITLVFVPLMIGFRMRATGKAKKLPTIIDRTSRRLARMVQAYATIGRLVALFIFAAAVIVLEQGAELAGQIGNVVAEAPFIASNIVVGLSGYLSLGGGLPYIGTLPLLGDMTRPVTFAAFVITVLALAAAVRWEGSGPLNQFLDRR